jgi:2-phosphosulfolactate phosphatase
MRIELFFTPQYVDDQTLRDRTVIVIDVLRASSSIITALSNGAREVIPAPTVEGAVKISGNLDPDVVLLAGERHAKLIPGFHLGNSPLEFTAERVKGKAIIFSSTNGAQALAKGRYARELAVCAFVNMQQVVSFLQAEPRPVVIIASGTNGSFSLEDTVCAGMLIHHLRGNGYADAEMSDGALAAMMLYGTLGNDMLEVVKMGEHGRRLSELGFDDDLRYCAGIDTVPVLPLLEGNVLKLHSNSKLHVCA